MQYFYYFHYYAIQALYQAGGKEWNDWHPHVRELLLDAPEQGRQLGRAAGIVRGGPTRANRIYPTAMATLILNIYRHYLPAYQR